MLAGNNKVREDLWDESLDEKMAPSLGGVVLGLEHSIYVDANEFFSRTLVTEGMIDVLENIASVLSGQGGYKIQVMSSHFGGGKTHLTIFIYHALRNPHLLKSAKAENGAVKVRLEALARKLEGLSHVKVVVIDGMYASLAPSPIEPLKTEKYEVRTLWGYIAHELESYNMVAHFDGKLTAPYTSTFIDILKGKKAVILVDELAEYTMRLYRSGDKRLTDYASQIPAFVKALSEAISMGGEVSLIITMPGKKEDNEFKLDPVYARDLDVKSLIDSMFRMLDRVTPNYKEPVTPRDVPALLRVRLFEQVDVSVARAVSDQLYNVYSENVEVFGEVRPEFTSRIRETYPFHPEYVNTLLDILDKHPSLQKTRDLLRVSRRVLRSVIRDNKRYALVMPWHLDVKRDPLRSMLLTGDYEGFKSVVDSDIVERCKRYDKPWVAEIAALSLFAKTFAYGGGIIPGPRPYPTRAELALAVYEPSSFSESLLEPKDIADAIDWIAQNLFYVLRDETTDRMWFTKYITPVKYVEERARNIDDVTALNPLVSQVKELLVAKEGKARRKVEERPTIFNVELSKVQQRCNPVDVDRGEYFVLVCLETPSIEELEKVVYEVSSGSRRRYANTVYVVYPSSSERLRNVLWHAKLYKACEDIEKEFDIIVKISGEEMEIARKIMYEKLHGYKENVKEVLTKGILNVFDKIAYPYYDERELRNTVKEAHLIREDTILRAVEKSLTTSAVGKLKSEIDFELLEYYLRNVKVDILEGRSRAVSEILDYFYTNPALPAVPKSAILEALGEGLKKLNIGVRCRGSLYFKDIIKCDSPDQCLRGLPERAEGKSINVNEDCEIIPWRDALKEQMEQLKRIETIEDNVPVTVDYVLRLEGKLVSVEEVLRELDKYNLETLRIAPLAIVKSRIAVKVNLNPSDVEVAPESDVEVRAVLQSVGPFEGDVKIEVPEGDVDKPVVSIKPGIPEEVIWRFKAPREVEDHLVTLTVKDVLGRQLGSATLTVRVRVKEPSRLIWVRGVPPAGSKVKGLRVKLEKLYLKPISILKNRLGASTPVSEGRLELKVEDISGKRSTVKLEMVNVSVETFLHVAASIAQRFSYGMKIESPKIEVELKPEGEGFLTFPDILEEERKELRECLEYLTL